MNVVPNISSLIILFNILSFNVLDVKCYKQKIFNILE